MEAVQRGSRLLWSRKLGTLFLGLTLAIAILALRQTLASAWYQNLGYVHLTRALLLLESGAKGLDSAHASFTQAVSWQDHNSSARWGLGEVYHQLGDDVAAVVEEWQRTEGALSRLLTASDAAFKAENYAEALDQALLALALDPDSSSAHYRVGEAYRSLGELHSALAEYEKAKELNSFLPDDEVDLASCYFGEARFYEAQANWDTAVWHYEVGLQLRPDASAYAALGRIYHYQLEDLPTAAAYLDQAIGLEPTKGWWHFLLGAVYADQEQYAKALCELQTALKFGDRAIETPHLYLYLGRAYYGLGHFQNAVQAYQQALMLEPDNGSAREGLDKALESQRGEE